MPASENPDARIRPCPVCGRSDSGESPCPTCGWSHGPGIPEEDPRHLVMFTLVQRAIAASTHMRGDSWSVFLRIRPGEREYAVLAENDHLIANGIYWRITEKDRGVFWMRGSEVHWSAAEGLRLKNPVSESEPEWVRDLRAKFRD